MPDLLQLFGRTRRLAPFGDCRELGLDGLIAHGHVAIGLTFLETLQERICRLLALSGRGEEQEMLRMLVFGTGLLEGALQDRANIADAYTPGRSGSGEHDPADEFGAGLRDRLRDEAAQRKAEKVDLREAKGLDERDGVLRHVGDADRGLAPEPPTPRLSKRTTWRLPAMPSRTFGSQSSSTAVRWCRKTTGTPPRSPSSRYTILVSFTWIVLVAAFWNDWVMVMAFLWRVEALAGRPSPELLMTVIRFVWSMMLIMYPVKGVAEGMMRVSCQQVAENRRILIGDRRVDEIDACLGVGEVTLYLTSRADVLRHRPLTSIMMIVIFAA